jgi:RNA polymerase sigma factor (sigma-70 family)
VARFKKLRKSCLEREWPFLRARLMRDAARMYRLQEDREDALQDVFVKLWEFYRLKPPGELWLIARTVLANNYCNWVRKSAKASRVSLEDAYREPKSSEWEDTLVLRMDGLAGLTPKQERAVILRSMGYSYEEISAMTGVGKSAVNAWIWRARAKARGGECGG